MLSLCVLFLTVELEDVLQLMLAETLYLESLLDHHLSLVHLLLYLPVLLGLYRFVPLPLLGQDLALVQLHVLLNAAVRIAFHACEAEAHWMRAFDSLCILHKGGRIFGLLVISAFRRMLLLLLFDFGLLHVRIALCKFGFVLPYQLTSIAQNGYYPLQILLKSLVLVLIESCYLHAAEAKKRLDAAIDITILQTDYLPQKVLNL